MRRVILESFWKSWGQGQRPDWTLLILHDPVNVRTFPTQVPNLSLNRNVKRHFGKARGRVGGPDWTLLIFPGPVKVSTFPTQVRDLSPNQNASDNFGTVGGRVRGLTGECCFSSPWQGGGHLPIDFPTRPPTNSWKTIWEKPMAVSGT